MNLSASAVSAAPVTPAAVMLLNGLWIKVNFPSSVVTLAHAELQRVWYKL